MKKLYILFLTLSTISASAQVISITPNDTINTTQSIANGSDQIEATLTVTNPTAATKNIKWTWVESTLPGGWENIQICDPAHCWADDSVGASHTFNLTATGTILNSGLFKVDFVTNCISGSGKIRLKTWETADSANTVQYLTFNFDLTASASCVAGVADFKAENIRFYPNPVKEDLKIIGVTGIKNMRADVFNVIGSKVLSKSFENNGTSETEIGAETLEQGVYFVKLYSNNKLIATKKFNKE